MSSFAGPSGRVVWGVGLPPLACWGCGFESHRGEWMFVCCECSVLLSGRGLYDELITGPVESYRVWCVVVFDLETSWLRRPWPAGGCCAKRRKRICRVYHIRAPNCGRPASKQSCYLLIICWTHDGVTGLKIIIFFSNIAFYFLKSIWIFQTNRVLSGFPKNERTVQIWRPGRPYLDEECRK